MYCKYTSVLIFLWCKNWFVLNFVFKLSCLVTSSSLSMKLLILVLNMVGKTPEAFPILLVIYEVNHKYFQDMEIIHKQLWCELMGLGGTNVLHIFIKRITDQSKWIDSLRYWTVVIWVFALGKVFRLLHQNFEWNSWQVDHKPISAIDLQSATF